MKSLRLSNFINIYFKWGLFRECSIWRDFAWGGGEWVKREGFYTTRHLLGSVNDFVYPYIDRLNWFLINKECVTFKYKDLILIVKFKISPGKWFKTNSKPNAAIEAIWNYRNDPKDEKFWVIDAGGINLAIKATDWTTEI